MTIDLLTATQDALFAALNVSAVTAHAPVFQHVPEDQQPPMVIVGDMEASPSDVWKGAEDHDVEIYTVFRGKGRRGVLTLMHAVRVALQAADLAVAGVEFEKPDWQSSSTGAADDGVTYAGNQVFRITVQPAG